MAKLSGLIHGAVLVFAGVCAACAGSAPGPTDVIASYTAALRDRRLGDAYRHLSVETRRAVSFEQFERLVRENPDEVQQTVRWLEDLNPQAPVTARMELPSGETLTLLEENGQWRLDPAVLDFYGQNTPRQSLRSFVRALERKRFDILLRFVPRHLSEGLTAELLQESWSTGPQEADVGRMLADMRNALKDGRPVEVVGDRATMQYGSGLKRLAQLVREDGVWKIEDPD